METAITGDQIIKLIDNTDISASENCQSAFIHIEDAPAIDNDNRSREYHAALSVGQSKTRCTEVGRDFGNDRFIGSTGSSSGGAFRRVVLAEKTRKHRITARHKIDDRRKKRGGQRDSRGGSSGGAFRRSAAACFRGKGAHQCPGVYSG